MIFKSGDRIQNINGLHFSNGKFVNTVSHVEKVGSHTKVWIRETETFTHPSDIELAPRTEQTKGNPDLTGPNNSQALKADAGKLQWSLVTRGCAKALLGVVKVMTVAVTPKPEGRGYAPGSWKLVPEAEKRYEDALFRHLSAIARGEVWDNGPEGTGQLHWDCVATNALFLSEFAHGEHDAPVNTQPA